MSNPTHDPFYSSPFGPFYRRHSPYMVQPEYRIYEMNKRLQTRTEESDSLWWDAFATEFFEEDATLTLSFCLEDGPKRYTIGRTLIPRYFSTVFEGGVTELHYILKHSKESFHNSCITLDCDQCTMVTQHGKPMFTKVCTEGRMILEFAFDDLMRIKTWHFTIRQYRELIPRSILAMHAQDPQVLEQLSKNITRMGLTNFTLNYLRLCVILEPMQELMSRHKTYNLSPRDCLKTCLFQKWQRMVAPPGRDGGGRADPDGRRVRRRGRAPDHPPGEHAVRRHQRPGRRGRLQRLPGARQQRPLEQQTPRRPGRQAREHGGPALAVKTPTKKREQQKDFLTLSPFGQCFYTPLNILLNQNPPGPRPPPLSPPLTHVQSALDIFFFFFFYDSLSHLGETGSVHRRETHTRCMQL
uniref:LIM domain binding 2a n=1 Tax=Scophthalmus maximus TaxID=52904 RepID=A0A8D3BPN0_SCOMX